MEIGNVMVGGKITPDAFILGIDQPLAGRKFNLNSNDAHLGNGLFSAAVEVPADDASLDAGLCLVGEKSCPTRLYVGHREGTGVRQVGPADDSDGKNTTDETKMEVVRLLVGRKKNLNSNGDKVGIASPLVAAEVPTHAAMTGAGFRLVGGKICPTRFGYGKRENSGKGQVVPADASFLGVGHILVGGKRTPSRSMMGSARCLAEPKIGCTSSHAATRLIAPSRIGTPARRTHFRTMLGRQPRSAAIAVEDSPAA